eukprot:2745418-Pleurochrysis_carterae.AAC.1
MSHKPLCHVPQASLPCPISLFAMSHKPLCHTFFSMLAILQGSNGEYAFVTTSGGDPGYEETSKIVAE